MLKENEKDKIEQEQKEKQGENKGSTLGTIVLIFAFLLAAYGLFGGSSSSDDDMEEEEFEIKSQSCETYSDTYHKCHYSIIEERCVCKER